MLAGRESVLPARRRGRNEKVPSGVCNGEIIPARRQLAVVSGRAQGRAVQAAWPGTSSPRRRLAPGGRRD